MSVTISKISDFVAGDDLEIERTNLPIPSGVLVSTAWFMIKRRFTDNDLDAVISKTITTVNDIDEGWIEDAGSSGDASLRFFLSRTETALLTPLSEYQYSIKTIFDDDKVNTPEIGVIVALPAIKLGIT